MERKFKIGDKVRVVKNVDENGKADKYIGMVGIIIDYLEDSYLLDIDRKSFKWYEEELEPIKEDIITELTSAIIEAAKNAPVMVERTEDGGIKISLIEEDLPIDTPCMCSSGGKSEWRLRYYAGNKQCYNDGNKSYAYSYMSSWSYIIPCDKFNFENPEESLKYNIVKQ